IGVEAAALAWRNESGLASRAQEKAATTARQAATTTGRLVFNGFPREVGTVGYTCLDPFDQVAQCRRQKQWRANAATEHVTRMRYWGGFPGGAGYQLG